jgi:DNA-binding helix-hairpin-helix protein with protein kinase domain
MVAGVGLCLLSPLSGWAWAGGAAATALAGAGLIFGREGKSRRAQADALLANFERLQSQLSQRSNAVTARHRQRNDSFENAVEQLRQEYENYRNANTQLRDILTIYRTMQKSRYLSSQLIQKNIRSIRGMSPSLAAALASFGIESAYDIEPIRLLGLPNINSERLLELQAWRADVERQFVYTPEPGLNLDSKRAADEGTIKRFKATVARRILMAARQLESVARSGKEQLNQDLKEFEKHAERVREAANELRDFQSNRRPLERLLNRTWGVALGVGGGVSLFGALLYWINH